MYLVGNPRGGFKYLNIKPKWPSYSYPPKKYNGLVKNLGKLMWQYHFHLCSKYGGFLLRLDGLHPKYPFNHPLTFFLEEKFLEKLKWFYWYLFSLYTISIEFPTVKMPLIISRIIQGEVKYKYF